VFLEVKGLTKHFDGVTAVDNVSFKVFPGEIFALIGPNGAGKTTVFNLISGILKPDSGDVKFKGKDLTVLKPFQIRTLGMARTFQNLQLFSSMSSVENVMAGAHVTGKKGFVQSLLRLPGVAIEEKETYRLSVSVMREMGLGSDIDTPASTLPFGKQRLLEIARALSGAPELLLLDEPAAGLNAGETKQLAENLKKLREKGLALILVEHDMDTVMEVADRILVLNFGIPIAMGTPEEIRNNTQVKKAYLGEDEEFEYAAGAGA
jgi:branched-chain amino acid transport system ATP-binding protein